MSARLSTHVLDLTTGKPAAGMRIELRNLSTGALIKTVQTNADGRTDSPLLTGEELHADEYELLFHVGDHFHAAGQVANVEVQIAGEVRALGRHHRGEASTARHGDELPRLRYSIYCFL